MDRTTRFYLLKNIDFPCFYKSVTDGPMDGPTNGRNDPLIIGDARTQQYNNNDNNNNNNINNINNNIHDINDVR